MKRIILLLLLAFSFQSWAQTDTSTIERVEIITIYEPDVAEAVKTEIDPTLEEPVQPPLRYEYSFPGITFRPAAVYSPIDPIFLKKQDDPLLNDNYIEAGMGNYLTTYLDANIFNTRDKYFTYGLQLKHHAASMSNNPYQGRFSENRVRAFGQREKRGTFRSMVDYRRNVVHYYGYDTSLYDFELKDINQIYNNVQTELGWSNNGGIYSNDIDLGFHMFDRLKNGESAGYLNFRNQFDIGRDQLNIDAAAMFNRIRQDSTHDQLFVDFKAHYQFSYRRFDIDAGLLINYINDFAGTNIPKFSPILRAETYLVPDLLRFHAGVSGGLQKNTMRALIDENPFVGRDLEFKNPFEVFNIQLGMNGKFKRFVEYGIKFSQAQVQDQYVFKTDTNAYRNLTVDYTDMSIFSFAGELKLFISNSLDVGFAGTVYGYGVDNDNFASHMPPYEAKVFATVRLAEKITVSSAFFMVGSRQALAVDDKVYDLGAINDLNLRAEYRYKKNISAFLHVQNILGKRYQIWNHHRAQGINGLIGIAISI